MTPKSEIHVLSYNVLFSKAWDENLHLNHVSERSSSELATKDPSYYHFMEKFYRDDFVRIWPDHDCKHKVVYQDGKLNSLVSKYRNGKPIPMSVVENDPNMNFFVRKVFDEKVRFPRIIKKIEQELEDLRSSKTADVNAIICLQEVSGTWEKRFREYFESRGWTFLIAKRNRVDQDNMGNAIAFKKDYFVIKRIQYGFPMFDSSIITKTDYPFDIERIKMSNEEAISNTNSVTDTTCGELTGNCDNESVVANNHADFNVRTNTDQIVQDLKDSDNDECGVASDTVDSIISLAFDSITRSPFIFLALERKYSTPSDKKNPLLIVGNYHMPQVIHRRSSRDVHIGNYAMGLHCIAIMSRFRDFYHIVKKSDIVPLSTDKFREPHAVMLGDWNTMPDVEHYQFIKYDHEFYFHNGRIYSTDGRQIAASPYMKTMAYLVQGIFLNSNTQLGLNNDLNFTNCYEHVTGSLPFLTTRTQEFQGAIDHAFLVNSKTCLKGLYPAKVRRMPSQKEATFWCPNADTEPSDHLLQRTSFSF